MYEYKELPVNFITKYGREYINLTSDSKMISAGYNQGGDDFSGSGSITKYTKWLYFEEADIYSNRESLITSNNRGRERIVYTTNKEKIEIFYTNDHYSTFEELTINKIQPISFTFEVISYIFYFLFSLYIVILIIFYKDNILKTINNNFTFLEFINKYTNKNKEK